MTTTARPFDAHHVTIHCLGRYLDPKYLAMLLDFAAAPPATRQYVHAIRKIVCGTFDGDLGLSQALLAEWLARGLECPDCHQPTIREEIATLPVYCSCCDGFIDPARIRLEEALFLRDFRQIYAGTLPDTTVLGLTHANIVAHVRREPRCNAVRELLEAQDALSYDIDDVAKQYSLPDATCVSAVIAALHTQVDLSRYVDDEALDLAMARSIRKQSDTQAFEGSHDRALAE